MIAYLVSATPESGIEDAISRGWTRIAYARFATPEKHDVRVIWRVSDLVPMAGQTPMLKARDYDGDSPEKWIKEKDGFDAFVSSGRGEWLESL